MTAPIQTETIDNIRSSTVVFVHGLGGAATKTWGQFLELIRGDRALGAWKTATYSYPSSIFAHPFFKLPRIQLIADGLRSELNSRHAASDLVLVCHSLGGLVARRYLVDEVEAGSSLRVKQLVLFATPNDGAGLAQVARYIAPWNRQLLQICRDSDFLERLNADWFRLNMDNLVEVRCIVGGRDGAVSEYSAKGLWGKDRVETVIDAKHRDIVKPIDTADLRFRLLKDALVASRTSGIKRSAAFLRGRSVEGTWIDVVRMPDGSDFFGLATITSDAGVLRFSVENINREGALLGSLSARQIEFDWPRILFIAEGSSPKPEYSEGIVVMLFEDSKSPLRFTARCLDYKQPLPDIIEGWKIENHEQLQRLSDPRRRQETLRQLIKTTFPPRLEAGLTPSNDHNIRI